MFNRRKKQAADIDRILDVPVKMWISSKLIAHTMDNGQILVVRGDFRNISDADAYLKVKNALEKIAA